MKIVAVVSGGMDSVVMAHYLKQQGHDLSLISFNYGQRHSKELIYASQAADDLDADHHIIDLTNITALISSSSLTNPDIEVPDGHYAEDTMRKTVVPNRNALMLNIAAAYAISIKADAIATAVHGGDHYIYPDCRPEFIDALNESLRTGNQGFALPGFGVMAPFINGDKTDIARLGSVIGVDFTKTWSCYKGTEIHCGSCGTCFERREALALAGVKDPTDYQSTPHFEDPR